MPSAEPMTDTAACRRIDRADLAARLAVIVGSQYVFASEDDRRFYSQDIFSEGVPPECAVQPGSTEELQQCAALCDSLEIAMIPRGAGMSYTSGYLADAPGCVTFDLTRMNRVMAISPEDMTVTVEAGCTWRTLLDALAPHGLRTPYWGPVSGGKATVGGVCSQNSTFWGAVRGGPVAPNVLGLDVVLADGTLLSTGARGGKDPDKAFFRHFGPELTGLFTGDCGALGLKARITLPLEDVPAHQKAISIGFDEPWSMLRALSEMARRQLITEVAFFDQVHQQARVGDADLSLRQMLDSFLAVAKSEGVVAALSMAVHGKNFLADVACSVHLVTEGATAQELKRCVAGIKTLARRFNGQLVPATIAQVLAAQPFPPPDMSLTAARFLPVHAIVPHSQAETVYREALRLFESSAEECRALGVRQGMFGGAAGRGTILLETTWHWTGAFLDAHPRLFEKDHASFAAGLEPAPEAAALVDRLAGEMIAMFSAHGAAHYQIGRRYPFQASRGEANWDWLQQIKRMADPKGLMNPGVLGFA